MIEQISTVTSGAAGLTAAGPMRPIMTPGFGQQDQMLSQPPQ